MRTICWFSCGAASAVAAHITLQLNPDAIVAYCDTGSEHEDNKRFIADCEKWYGKEILILKSKKYADIWDVFTKTRYLVGIHGARCTTELKKLVRQEFSEPDDTHVFGFTSEEARRLDTFRGNNPEITVSAPLVEQSINKQRCYQIVQDAGLVLPVMYRMGYRNNNCIGCVKGGAGYWNKIKRDFPDVFARMAALERELNVAICATKVGGVRRRVFLDELQPEFGRYEEVDISCGMFCGENGGEV